MPRFTTFWPFSRGILMAKHRWLQICVFRTRLGWIALGGRDEELRDLTFGHTSAEAARKRIERLCNQPLREGNWFPVLRRRLEDYAEGAPVDFLDIYVQRDAETPFTCSVIEACRGIPYGETLSYGDLADRIGAPRAARAVGNVMRSNRTPLVVPCHRVVHSDGRIGGFSAPQGASMKDRLLAMEAGSSLCVANI